MEPTREATFNLYNFSTHDQQVVEAAGMDEDRLISAVSLPMWFPPVEIDDSLYVDAVMATDANLEEAIDRGADELWVIWTVGTRGKWRNGFIAQYFQMIEAMANGKLRATLKRIERNNAAEAAGQRSEYGRHIEVKLLQAEVPLHYLMNFTQDRMAAAVELGVTRARQWCDAQGIAYTPIDRKPWSSGTSVRFTEEMAGYVRVGAGDPAPVRRHQDGDVPCKFHLTIDTGDLDSFIAQPEHAATAVGWVESAVFGGRRPVERGRFNLFVDQEDPTDKRMLYELWFTDDQGRQRTLAGHKVIIDDPGLDLWPDTTTLYTKILDGHVDRSTMDQRRWSIAAGILRIKPMMFARQLTTFRSSGGTFAERAGAMSRFARLFTGALWDVYVSTPTPERALLSSGRIAMAYTPPPRPASESELGFVYRRPVHWFSPPLLARAGMKVMLSAAFGDYLDKRELQQAFNDWVPTDHAEDAEMWLDVIADTADGFNPTYTVAWCASQRDLQPRGM